MFWKTGIIKSPPIPQQNHPTPIRKGNTYKT